MLKMYYMQKQITLPVGRSIPEIEQYSIHFDVTDGENGIEGATVTINGVSKNTGSAGGCNFNNMNSGTVTVEVTKTGYVSKSESISIDNEHTSFSIVLTKE